MKLLKIVDISKSADCWDWGTRRPIKPSDDVAKGARVNELFDATGPMLVFPK